MYVSWPVCGSSLSVIPNPKLPAPGLPAPGLSGLGCCCSDDSFTPRGLGIGSGRSMSGSYIGMSGGRGLGYFESGFNPSGWGIAEWLTVLAAGYAVATLLVLTPGSAPRLGI